MNRDSRPIRLTWTLAAWLCLAALVVGGFGGYLVGIERLSPTVVELTSKLESSNASVKACGEYMRLIQQDKAAAGATTNSH